MHRSAGGDGGSAGRMPLSVSNASGLLCVQAALWAAASAGVLAVWADNARRHGPAGSSLHGAWFAGAGIMAFATTAGLAAGFALLGRRLQRATPGIRIAVVVVESLMACFGVLIAYVTAAAGAGITAIVPVLAGLAGAAVSLVAAAGLLRKPARRFTARPAGGR